MTDGEIFVALATIVAIIVGPILAVLVTRFIDDQRAAKARRMDIFRTLMRTRKMPIHFEHVGALNLVEIEFAKQSAVIQAWRNYFASLVERHPETASQDEKNAFAKKRDSLLTKLIHEIAKSLKFEVEQLDILEGNYIPQGWNDDDWEQRMVRRGLIEVLQGRRPLNIQPFAEQNQNSPYPPPPQVLKAEPNNGDGA